MGPKKKKAKDVLFMTDDELQELEEAKKRAEQERLERERLQKEMEEELRKAKVEKKKREEHEMKCEEFRNQLLQEHCSAFRDFKTDYINYLIEKRRENEWQAYVSCNHLPFANDPPALNTFLYTWTMIEDQLNMDNILKESEIILETIKPVDVYIETPLDMKENTLFNLKEVKLNYYNQILKNVDIATFDAIMDVKKYHKLIEPGSIEIYKESENFKFWMWAWSIEGRSEMKSKKKKRPERKLPMMSFTLPGILTGKRHHLRIFYTSFDPYSFQSESFNPPQVSSCHDLFEETVNIRKMEVHALKLRYMSNYDEDIMPWWFLMDKEILEDKAKKEQLKKSKGKKKKAISVNQTETQTSESGTQMVSSQIAEEGVELSAKHKKKKKKKPESSDDYASIEENDSETPQYRFSKPGCTSIVYSRSMSNLLEERKYECSGPEYFSEVDPIEYLEHKTTTSYESSMERYKDLYLTEKHTTFKACIFNQDDNLSDGTMLRDINDCLNRSDPSEMKLSFTDRRAFLDWKSFRDVSPDREAIREELEEMLFGDSEMIIDNGEVKFVKRPTNLRSLKDLLDNTICTKGSFGNVLDHKEDRETRKEQEHVINIHPTVPDVPVKVTNVTEMKAVEMDIANVLNMAWQDNMDNYISKLMLNLEPDSINLRQVMVIGGVFQFDFFEDEPQPFVSKELFKTQLHYGEYELKRVLFDQVPQIRIDLAAEAERQMNQAKRQKSLRKMSRLTFSANEAPIEDSVSMAMGDDDLVWISLQLPKEKLYFETPMPIRWNAEKMYWTAEDVYDAKWNEKTYTCSFKLGKSGPFAISIFRFCNLPYYNFSMKPSSDWNKNPEIELEINARYVTIKFKIKEETVTIDTLDDPRVDYIAHIINVPFTFEKLVVAMRSSGIDLFPDWDSFLYINITLKKLKTLEEHMYYCMGLTAPAFEYSASLHNSGTRDDRIYVQLRESVDKVAPPPFRTILADPFKVIFIGGEKVGSLVEENEEGIGYTPDLKYLTETIASKKALRRMKKASKRTIGTLISLLTATKVLSYT